MNLPPSEDKLPDDLIRAYRRVSAADGSRPSDAVRQNIQRKARQLVAAATTEVAASRPQDSFDTAAPAANESRWRWKAAASVAVLGLTGLLALYTLRSSPRAPQLAGATAVTDQVQSARESAAPAAALAPAPMPAPMPIDEARNRLSRNNAARSDAAGSIASPSQTAAPTAASPPAPTPAPMSIEQPQNEIAHSDAASADLKANGFARQTPSALVARTNAALAAQMQSQMQIQAQAQAQARAQPSTLGAQITLPSDDQRRQQVLAAVRAAFPEPSGAGLRIAVVMNRDGTVYKMARLQRAADATLDAAAQIAEVLGVRADELDSPAASMTLAATTDQSEAIVVVYGIRRDGLGTSAEPP